ncbi:MAG: DNA internalization-related competence protein ComEC/Rec2 [Oscillospiraceae bacterium]|jgi:competence protein ComEC|nr:DNA internalization-related competence protein ComEC/Rec2 [Oscillospiraceae bacterium]
MRKLAVAAIYFAVAIFISRYFLRYEWLLISGLITAATSAIAFFFKGNIRRRILIALLSMAVGFLWSLTYTAFFVKPYWHLHEEIVTVNAVVTDYPVARTPRGYRVDSSYRQSGASSVGLRIYYNNETELKPGDVIEITARMRRTDITDDGDRFDMLSSRGLFLSGYVSGNINIIGFEDGFRYIPKRIAEKIAQMIDEIYPDDVSPFMQALLMGKRDDLYKDTALSASLSASGIVHIISISGMHISFLMSFLALVIKNKRLFALFGIPALMFFMAMTGFTPAVTRAGIMQMFLICAPMIRRDRDSITSLSASLFVLLASNPYSCASVGLHLSFSATLGIIIFTTKINSAITESLRRNKYYKMKPLRVIINFITSSLATTMGAIILTLPLTVIHFGYISLIAPLTNLLTLGAVSLAFPLGLIAAFFGFINPLFGSIAAFPVSIAARYIIYTASILAAIPYSVIYSSNIHIMIWLAYIYVIYTALPLLKARIRQYIYPSCIAFILLFTVILISPLMSVVKNNSVSVLDVGQGMSVVVTSGEYTMVVDCGSNSAGNAGEITHEFLLNLGRTSVDLLVITHFHDDHVNGVEFLLSRIAVSALAIPDPEKSYIAEDIIGLARKRGTDIIYVTETLGITFNDTQVFLYPPVGYGDENERGISVLTVGDVTTLITGDMNASTERSLLRFAALPKLDLLIVGHHGSRHSTSEELLQATLPDIAVIPVGRNSFGHPTTEVLERLNKYGAIIYRTDQAGHVTIER